MALLDSLADANKLAAAGDTRGAIGSLLDAFRVCRAPAIAKAIEDLTARALPEAPPPFDDAITDLLEAGRCVARLVEGNAAAATGLVARVQSKDDPRVAAAIVRLVRDPAYHATGAQPFWTRVWALLAANADPRSAAPLAKIRYAKIINGNTMRTWMSGKVKAELAALKKLPAPRLPAEAKTALAKLAKVKVSPAAAAAAAKAGEPRARYATGGSEKDLYAAVYENPDDDAPRAVLADFLMERGDPRGELISLQLAPRPHDDKRALKILRKHQRVWVGAIAPLVYLAYPSVDEIDPLRINTWWRRGFLAGSVTRFTRSKLIALAGLPIWHTMERLSSLGADDDAESERALDTLVGNLRAIKHLESTTAGVIASVARVPRAQGRLERVSVLVRGGPQLRKTCAHLATFPKLADATVNIHFEDPASVEPILANRLHERIANLRVGWQAGTMRLQATPGGLAITVEEVGYRSAELYTLLAGERIASLSFVEATPAQRREIAAILPGA